MNFNNEEKEKGVSDQQMCADRITGALKLLLIADKSASYIISSVNLAQICAINEENLKSEQ